MNVTHIYLIIYFIIVEKFAEIAVPTPHTIRCKLLAEKQLYAGSSFSGYIILVTEAH